MEYICPRIKRGDPASWQAHFPKTYKGLLNLYGAAQADFAWRVRVATRVKMAFSAIFGTEDLTVSQDAVIVEAQKRARKRPSWLHKDQAPDLPTGYSIQGIYSYWPSAPTDAGTCLVPKSHLTIYDWENEQRELWHKNWLLAPDQSARTSVKPLVPENSLILFDSRLLHANVDAAEPVASNRHGTSGGTSDHGTQRAERREGLADKAGAVRERKSQQPLALQQGRREADATMVQHAWSQTAAAAATTARKNGATLKHSK